MRRLATERKAAHHLRRERARERERERERERSRIINAEIKQPRRWNRSFSGKARAVPVSRDGEPGDGGPDPAGQPNAGCVLRHRSEREPGPAADRGGGRTERREELRARELRGEVSALFIKTHTITLTHTNNNAYCKMHAALILYSDSQPPSCLNDM